MTRNDRIKQLRDQIQTMESNGASVNEMMKALNVSRDMLYYHRKHLKLTRKSKKLNLTIDQRQQIKELVRQNQSYKTVANQFGISASTVKLVVHDNDSINNRHIKDVLANSVNALLARHWA